MRVKCSGLAAVLALTGCLGEGRDGEGEMNPTGIGGDSLGDEGDEDDGDDGDEDDEGGDRLDVGAGETDGLPCGEGMECDECVEWEHTPCDEGTTDLFKAMGLNCPGEQTVTVTATGSLQAMGVRTRFGNTDEWLPREGNAYGVIGSGFVSDLDNETPAGDLDIQPSQCNDDLGAEYDVGTMLPAPLRVNNVGGDCTTDPSLLGTGDCSNTVQGQFSQGGSAFDYTEVRIEGKVPESNNSLSYDFAFFSVEYPFYYDTEYNDMYVGWLESESWTGNISFDEQGQPISLNAGFLDFRDDGGTMVPEFAGTCMKRHAGTKWLSTTAPVTPGETITLVLAIFDLSDPILDSYVFLDNFVWGCEGEDRPTTKPVG